MRISASLNIHHVRLVTMLAVSGVMFETGALAAEKTSLPSRPNIVLIMADDLGFSDLGCYGGEIKTPHLDQLAQQGARFRQFYNCGLCSPSRYCLMTGRWPQADLRLSDQTPTVAQAMRGAGYVTSISGKWNLQNQQPYSPLDWGFDRFYGILDAVDNHFNPAVSHHPSMASGKWPLAPYRLVWDNRHMLTEYPADFDLTDAVANHAAKTIGEFAKTRSPFFVYVPFYAPHIPLQAKPEAIAACLDRYTAGWDRLRNQRFENAIELGLIDTKWKLGQRDPDLGPWSGQQHQRWQASRIAVYAAMVEALDTGVGRILDALEQSGVRQNTLVMFLSDNGGKADPDLPLDRPDIVPGSADTFCTPGLGWGTVMNAPFRGAKQTTSEGGIASPFIAAWPGVILPNSLISDVCHIIDIAPTLLELSQPAPRATKDPKSLTDGLSLVPILHGKSRTGHEQLFWYFGRQRLQGGKAVNVGYGAAIRQGKWKLNWNEESREWDLFDLESDRTETTNLAHQSPERVSQMKQALNAWQRQQKFAESP